MTGTNKFGPRSKVCGHMLLTKYHFKVNIFSQYPLIPEAILNIKIKN